MTRAAIVQSALLALVLVGTACGGKRDAAQGNAGPAKKVFNYARVEAYKSLDPVKQFDQASTELIANLYDPLLQYNYLKRPYELEPDLLTKMPELGADGLTYSFELRTDVRFNDDPCFAGGKGRALTSDDVIYSFKRFADANLNLLSYSLGQGAIDGMDAFHDETKRVGKDADYKKLDVAGLKKVDDRHFTIKLTRTNPLALYLFATPYVSIVPHEAVEHYKDQFEHHPVGSGPFFVQQMSRRGVIVLAKNPHYHQTYPAQGAPGDAERGLLTDAGKRLPLVDEVELPLIEETQPAMLKFLSGSLDWVPIDKDNFVKMAFKDKDGFHLKPDYAGRYNLYEEPDLRCEYFAFNMKDPLVGKNRALREAIAYAFDTPRFIDQMRNGRALPLKTLVPRMIGGSERDVPAQWYARDLEMAKKKLAEAGYPGGKGLPPITMEYRASTTLARNDYEFTRAQLADAGITLKGAFQTFSAYLQKLESGNFQMTENGWGADYPDAENFYALLYGPNKTPGPNQPSYANPEYDKLYEQTRYMPNGPERYALFARMNELIRRDLPVIFTFNYTLVGLYQHWVKNFKRNVLVDMAAFRYFDVDPARKAKGVH